MDTSNPAEEFQNGDEFDDLSASTNDSPMSPGTLAKESVLPAPMAVAKNAGTPSWGSAVYGLSENDSGARGRFVQKLDLDKREISWKSAPYETVETTSIEVVSGFVLLHDDFSLLALSEADGTEVWRQKMPEPVRSGCDACFKKIGDDRLLTVSTDGTVTVWEPKTKRAVWSYKTDLEYSQIEQVGDFIVIAESSILPGSEEARTATAIALKVSDGTISEISGLVCDQDISGVGNVRLASISTTKVLVKVSTCWLVADLDTGAVRPVNLLGSILQRSDYDGNSDGQPVVEGNGVYTAIEGGLLYIDLSTNEGTKVAGSSDRSEEWSPIGAYGSYFLAAVKRDGQGHAVVLFNLEDRKKLSEIPYEDSSPCQESRCSALQWFIATGSDPIIMKFAVPEPEYFDTSISRLSPETLSLMPAITRINSGFSPSKPFSANGSLVMGLDGGLAVLDPDTLEFLWKALPAS